MDEIQLKLVTKTDVNFLYELLSQRKHKENISHEKIPSIKKHTMFVNSKPYSKWYILIKENIKIGSIYLSKQNEIGIHLIKGVNKKNIWYLAIKEIIKKNKRKKYFLNVNPKNLDLIKFVKSHNLKLIQYTYELSIK